VTRTKSVAVEFVPYSDFTYCRVRKQARNRGGISFFTPEQVEIGDTKGMYDVILSQYDLTVMARACLNAAGFEDIANQIPVLRAETLYGLSPGSKHNG
jgi:hypothetical protein